MQSLANDQVLTLPLDSSQGFDANNFASLAPANFMPGYTRVTAFINGTPSISQIALYAPRQTQTIAFPPVAPLTYGNPPVTLDATASSGLPVVYGVISGPATISGNTLTPTGVGSVLVQAGQAGNNTYASASAQQTITVVPTPQTITFPAILGTQYVGSSITLSATASSGLPVSYSVLSGPAMLTGGGSLLYTGAGTVTVQASQAGNADIAPAPPVNESIVVTAQTPQTITFPALADQLAGAPPITLAATASSGLTVTYSVTGPATVAGNVLTLTGIGQVSVTAYQAGNIMIAAAAPVTQSFDCQSPQTITFPAIANQVYGATFTLGATASSGLPLSYTTTGPVSISGNIATITGLGEISIRAHQNGNASYLAAPSVVQHFSASPASQTITLPTIPSQVPYSPAPIALPASASSGLPITYIVISGPASISNDVLTLTMVGAVVLTANQPGNADYTAAPEVTVSFTVNPAPQTITFPAIGNQFVGAGPITLNATSSSGLPVTYTTTGPVHVSGDTLTITGVGTAIIGAHQAGNSNYTAAPEIRQVITITAAGQLIYNDSGGNTTGWTQLAGTTTYPGNTGSFDPPGGFVPFAGATSSGSVIATSAYDSIYSLPVSVSGNFTMSFQVMANEDLSTEFGPILFNSTQTQFILSSIGDFNDSIQEFPSPTNAGTPTILAGIPSNGPRLTPPGLWHTMVLQRSGTVVTYSFDGALVASYNFDVVTPYGIGFAWAGDSTYQIRNIEIENGTNPLPQTITFPSIPSQNEFSGPVALTATSSSGLPVSYSVVSGPATISGTNVTLTGAGTVVLAATQTGNATFAAAPEVMTSFTVTPETQTYSDMGNNITGWTQLAGVTSYPGNTGSLDGPGGFVPFAGVSSNATVISTSGYDSVYALPAAPSGNFTMSFQVMANADYSTQFGPILFNSAKTQFIWSYLGDDDDSMVEFSSLTAENVNTVLSGIPSNGPRVTPPGVWHAMKLQRVGSVITFSVDGTQIASYNFNAVVTSPIGLGLAWAGGSTYQIKDLSVTSP